MPHKITKRKPTKRKPTKRKPNKRKPTKRKPTKQKPTKRKPTKRKPTKRKPILKGGTDYTDHTKDNIFDLSTAQHLKGSHSTGKLHKLSVTNIWEHIVYFYYDRTTSKKFVQYNTIRKMKDQNHIFRQIQNDITNNPNTTPIVYINENFPLSDEEKTFINTLNKSTLISPYKDIVNTCTYYSIVGLNKAGNLVLL